MKMWHVYMMANRLKGVIYIGMTDCIEERVKEHKLKTYPNSFTTRYNCDKLVYMEEYDDGAKAIQRERQMKKWKRDWKIELIESQNPAWMDISMNWSFNYNVQRNER